MSKISETKALEAYPILFSERNGYDHTFKDRRESYIKGYDQAMQDFLEKAEEYLRNEFVDMWLRYFRGSSVDEEIEMFKNYMQDESEN